MAKLPEIRNQNDWMGTFSDLPKLRDSFDRLFNEMIGLRGPSRDRSLQFAPICDIEEDDGSYLLNFDLPGVSKENVRVSVEENQLTVTAERREEHKKEGKRKHLSEINYGSYERSFTLPTSIDESKVEAKFDNGVLTVRVPKGEESKAKPISIQ